MVVYGARYFMACAFERSPSALCPVDAPVKRPILNSRPASCSACAFLASSCVTAFAVPAGVKPLRPMFWPFCINAAASAAVMRLYAIMCVI